jgi:hypothetical protein
VCPLKIDAASVMVGQAVFFVTEGEFAYNRLVLPCIKIKVFKDEFHKGIETQWRTSWYSAQRIVHGEMARRVVIGRGAWNVIEPDR